MSRLVDAFGRAIEYLRLSVTDRCDLRCSYRLPRGFRDSEKPDRWLDFREARTGVGQGGARPGYEPDRLLPIIESPSSTRKAAKIILSRRCGSRCASRAPNGAPATLARLIIATAGQ